MSQFISLEIEGEQIADLMGASPDFALEVWRELASRTSMGALKDDAADLVAGLPREEAKFISDQFIALGNAMKSGFNMANLDTI